MAPVAEWLLSYTTRSRPEAIATNYVRYLQNSLRDEFQFTGTPLIVSLRARRAARGETLPELG